MPTSNLDVAPTLINIIKQVNPDSILDFGVGFGKYGFLLREYLDVQRLAGGFSGNLADHFLTKIDGIEIDRRYIGEIQRKIYNHIYIGDGSKIIDTLGDYDVVLLLDVLEHFTKEDGLILLEKVYKKVRKTFVIVTPAFDYRQDEVFGNENEKHLSVWDAKDFSKYTNIQYKILDKKEILLILIHKHGSTVKIPSLRDGWSGKYLLREFQAISCEILAKLRAKPRSLLTNFRNKISKLKNAEHLCQ